NHSRARMLAPDGRCKAFAAAADGMVRAEGCGLVLLKRLSEAIRDNDPLVGIIRGSATNQDGRSSGLTVPNGLAQERVVRRALRQAGLEPADISYVEAHGTGTALGDPIEAAALTAVFGPAREKLAVGSVKTNVGHLEAAAGVAGVIKVVLAMQSHRIPASLHCEVPNPNIAWGSSPLYIPKSSEPWTRGSPDRSAGVSSFGFGGTNAHVVLGDPPALPSRQAISLQRYLLPLSAKSASALETLATRYATFLLTTKEHPGDICFTAACGRDHLRYRLAVLGGDLVELRVQLNAWLAAIPSRGVSHISDASGEAFRPGGTPQAAIASAQDWAELAARYRAGEEVDWAACYRGLQLRRVLVPGHPFERQSYMVQPASSSASEATRYRLL